MANPFKKIGGFFATVFRFFSSDAAQRVAEQIQEYARAALPIVKFIASITPTRVDDEIIALFEHYGLRNVEAYLALPQSDRGAALVAAALWKLRVDYPGTSVANLRAGIELAVSLARVK